MKAGRKQVGGPTQGERPTESVIKALAIAPDEPQHAQAKPQQKVTVGDILDPSYNPQYLAQLPDISSTLDELLDAMAQNIDGFGFELGLRPGVKITDETPEEIKTEIEQERNRLTMFFEYCSPNESFTELRKRTRYDLELYGWAGWEVIRDTKGDIAGIERIPSVSLRATKLEARSQLVKTTIWVPQPDGSVMERQAYTRRTFRRYVQVLENGRKIYFRALGDPRPLDAETGEYISEKEAKHYPPEKLATEVIWFSLPSTTNSPYGKPRYISEIYSITGTREAERVNYETLSGNMIPALMIAVSGGAQLTEGTNKRVKEWLKEVEAGYNMSKALLLEAQSSAPGIPTPNAKIDITKMRDLQREDAMFMKYLSNNDERIRACFRLPDIFTGGGGKYNRAVADRMRKTAEEQVFDPLRKAFGWKMDTELLAAMGTKYHRFVSRGPSVHDDAALATMMTKAEATGGMTPRIARQMMTLMTGDHYGEIDPEKLDPDVPYSMQLAKVKTGVVQKGVENEMDGQAVLNALFGMGTGQISEDEE